MNRPVLLIAREEKDFYSRVPSLQPFVPLSAAAWELALFNLIQMPSFLNLSLIQARLQNADLC